MPGIVILSDSLSCTPGVCDVDVDTVCAKSKDNPKNRGIWSIGAVGRCLSRQLAENKALSPGCHTLVAVAAPKVRSSQAHSRCGDICLLE